MKLVLQCAMCGTHHAVGTPACTTCRASGVAQMRLMFECPTCGHLGINPVCEACAIIEPLELDDDLIVAEEVTDDSTAEDFELDLDFDDEEDEALVVDLSEESFDDDEDSELDEDIEEDDIDEDFDEDDEEEDDSELDDEEDPLDEEDEDD